MPSCPLPSGGGARPALHWWSPSPACSGPGASAPSLPGTGAPHHGFWSRHHRPDLPTTPTRPLVSPWPAPDATRPGQEQEMVLASLISWLHDPESKVGRKESRRVPGGGGVDGAHGDTDTARKCRQVEAARGEEGQRPLVMERTAWGGGHRAGHSGVGGRLSQQILGIRPHVLHAPPCRSLRRLPQVGVPGRGQLHRDDELEGDSDRQVAWMRTRVSQCLPGWAYPSGCLSGHACTRPFSEQLPSHVSARPTPPAHSGLRARWDCEPACLPSTHLAPGMTPPYHQHWDSKPA